MDERCLICLHQEGDAEFDRLEVWGDDLWRLTVSLDFEIAGFSYLEPKRHIPHIEDLDGPEATTFGTVLASTTAALKDTTGATRVFIYAFGGQLDHLHFFLVPVKPGHPVVAQIIEGEVESERRVGGAVRWGSTVAPKVARSELEAVAGAVQNALVTSP
jgi:diadenosine tetraphosphate (Ap4A) HIT family hydrolase